MSWFSGFLAHMGYSEAFAKLHKKIFNGCFAVFYMAGSHNYGWIEVRKLMLPNINHGRRLPIPEVRKVHRKEKRALQRTTRVAERSWAHSRCMRGDRVIKA